MAWSVKNRKSMVGLNSTDFIQNGKSFLKLPNHGMTKAILFIITAFYSDKMSLLLTVPLSWVENAR